MFIINNMDFYNFWSSNIFIRPPKLILRLTSLQNLKSTDTRKADEIKTNKVLKKNDFHKFSLIQ